MARSCVCPRRAGPCGHTAAVGSCWESGGPEWLFVSALLGVSMAAPFGALTWLAWSPPRVPEPSWRDRRFSMAFSGASFIFGTFVFFQTHRSASDVAFVLATVALGVALVAVLDRAHRASRAGLQLAGGMAVAYGVVRWSTVVAASVATTVGVASVVTMAVLGHSCTGV